MRWPAPSIGGVPCEIVNRNLAGENCQAFLPSPESTWLYGLQRIFQSVSQELCLDRFSGQGRATAFTFTNRMELNAYADIEGAYGIIAMNVGSFYVLLDFFAALFSHPQLFPSVGHPEQEQPHFERLKISERGIVVEEFESRACLPRFEPKDPQRAHFARLLTNLTLEFMFLHEVSHVVAGHPLILSQELYGRSPLQAHSWEVTGATSESLFYRHGLETRADLDAAIHQVLALWEGDSFIVKTQHLPAMQEDRFFALTVAICSYFFLTSPNAYNKPWSKHCSHPHPYLRLAEVSDFFSQVFGKTNPDIAQNWFQGYIRALEELIRAWETIGMGSLRLADYFEDINVVMAQSEILRKARLEIAQWETYDLRHRIDVSFLRNLRQ